MANITGPVKQYTVSIGGIGLKFVADDSLLLNVNETYQKFMTKNEKVDINIKVHFGELPEIVLDKKVLIPGEQVGPGLFILAEINTYMLLIYHRQILFHIGLPYSMRISPPATCILIHLTRTLVRTTR